MMTTTAATSRRKNLRLLSIAAIAFAMAGSLLVRAQVPPLAYDNYAGYTKIFDGTTLKGWDGDPTFWRVEGGAIVGESTATKKVTENTFMIWRGGEPADFTLKVEFRINSTNSGVQYRSKQLTTGVTGKWVLCGYQADIDFGNQYTGMLYEERGRTFLARRGMVGYSGSNTVKKGQCNGGPNLAQGETASSQIGSLESSDALKALIKVNDWNQFEVNARGTTLTHILNGHVTALFIDDDQANRMTKGLIGFQMHMGEPMKVEFRNVYLKEVK